MVGGIVLLPCPLTRGNLSLVSSLCINDLHDDVISNIII